MARWAAAAMLLGCCCVASAPDVVVFRHWSADVNPKAPQPTGKLPTCIRNPTVARLGSGVSDKSATLLAVCVARPPVHLRPSPSPPAQPDPPFRPRSFPTSPDFRARQVAECRYWAGDGCQPQNLSSVGLGGPWPEPTRGCSRLSTDRHEP